VRRATEQTSSSLRTAYIVTGAARRCVSSVLLKKYRVGSARGVKVVLLGSVNALNATVLDVLEE